MSEVKILELIRSVCLAVARAIGRIATGTLRLVASRLHFGDSWQRIPVGHGTHLAFGSRTQFADYLQAPSDVSVTDVEKLCAWLSRCRYERLSARPAAFWQPRTLERSRSGDCKARSLWAWRKLADLGLNPLLVNGRADRPVPASLEDEPRHGNHVWVIFEMNGREYVVETTERDASKMVRPKEDVAAEYTPYLGVDSQLRVFRFSGWVRDWRSALRLEGTGATNA